MAGKARVHELAKELGVTSKDVLKKLADLGEYVKSASSTVEAPVARKLRDSFPSDTAKAPYANGAPASGPASGGAATGAFPPSVEPPPSLVRSLRPVACRNLCLTAGPGLELGRLAGPVVGPVAKLR